MGGTHNRTQVMRVFDAIQDDQQFRGGRDVFQIRVLFLGAERDYALVRLNSGDTVQCTAILEAHRRVGFASQIDDFLDAGAGQSTGNQDAFEWAFGAKRFSDRMDSDEQGQNEL